MALEQFLPEGEEWDVPIVDGITLATLLKYWVSVWETGFVSSELNAEVSFTVMYRDTRVKMRMLVPNFGPAYRESNGDGKDPVIYIEGELFGVLGHGGHSHLPVRGLYSTKTHTGGFMITGEILVRDFGHRFKENPPRNV